MKQKTFAQIAEALAKKEAQYQKMMEEATDDRGRKSAELMLQRVNESKQQLMADNQMMADEKEAKQMAKGGKVPSYKWGSYVDPTDPDPRYKGGVGNDWWNKLKPGELSSFDQYYNWARGNEEAAVNAYKGYKDWGMDKVKAYYDWAQGNQQGIIDHFSGDGSEPSQGPPGFNVGNARVQMPQFDFDFNLGMLGATENNAQKYSIPEQIARNKAMRSGKAPSNMAMNGLHNTAQGPIPLAPTAYTGPGAPASTPEVAAEQAKQVSGNGSGKGGGKGASKSVLSPGDIANYAKLAGTTNTPGLTGVWQDLSNLMKTPDQIKSPDVSLKNYVGGKQSAAENTSKAQKALNSLNFNNGMSEAKNKIMGMAGLAAPFMDNIAMKKYMDSVKPDAVPDMMTAPTMQTNYDINPQLQEARTGQRLLNRSLDQSNTNRGVANANKVAGFSNRLRETGKLHSAKANVENQLKNQDARVRSGIANQNTGIRNQYAQSMTDFNNQKAFMKYSNKVNMGEDIMNINEQRLEQERQKQMLAIMKPYLDRFKLYSKSIAPAYEG